MSTVRPAASVLLHRQDGRVFWVRRGEQLRFAGGFYAFPGGRVDLDDAAVPLVNGGHLGAMDAPIVVAAARELFEETGVLAVPGAGRIAPLERRQVREWLLGGTTSFAELLARHDLRVDASQFLPAGRWVTPHAMPVRFDAHFFLVELPPGEEAEVWPGELADGEWILPREALARWESGSALLHPPAWHSLKSLASVTSAREALPLLVDPARAPWKLPIRENIVQRIEFQRGVVMVPLRTPTLPPATHTNCLLLGDDKLWIVDPGSPYPEEQEVLRRTLATLSSEGRSPVGILLTHHHHDHVAGAEVLRDEWRVPIAATQETAALLAGDGGPHGPSGGLRVDRVLVDGERLEVGPRGWRCLHLPGHTRGHLCLIENESGALVAGDLIAGTGTVVIDPPDGDMKDYLQSLDRLLNGEAGQKPGTIYPAHGPVVPAGLPKIEGYVAHRLEREKRVIESLLSAKGPATPAELVPAAYAEVDPALYPLAERSLLAHLIKLVKDGRARERDGRYEPLRV